MSRGFGRYNAPINRFGDHEGLKTTDADLRKAAPDGQLALTGPSQCAKAPRMAVRGDLAHIGLAGKCFVPHYAVPVPYRVGARGAALMPRAEQAGEPLAILPASSRFDVLDIAGAWAWGQCADADGASDGLVGYVSLSELSQAEQ